MIVPTIASLRTALKLNEIFEKLKIEQNFNNFNKSFNENQKMWRLSIRSEQKYYAIRSWENA